MDAAAPPAVADPADPDGVRRQLGALPARPVRRADGSRPLHPAAPDQRRRWCWCCCAARAKNPRRDWGGALALITYGAAFSFSYLTLTAGTGALLLFAAVQLSMLAPPLLRGEALPRRQWLGLLLAMTGLVVLLLPGLSAPDPLGRP